MSTLLDRPLLCPILVGREKYLDVLQQHLEEARDGHGHTLLLSGEAGVGKSRLVTEANIWGHKHGMEVLRGNCFESDRMLPFGPILDLLRRYTKADTAKELKSLATELVKRLLDVRVPSPEIQPLSSLQPAQEKKQYFQTLDELFIENASGLLLIVEDLHWCDDASLEFLLHFARQISTTPILLLLTYRNDEVQSSLVHFLAVLDQARLASELTLDRLLQAKQVHLMGKASFPNMSVQTEDLISEGDRVIERWTQTQTRTGAPFMGIPASHKPIVMTGMSIYRIVNGKIAEHWGNMDFFGMMAQMGAIPSPGM